MLLDAVVVRRNYLLPSSVSSELDGLFYTEINEDLAMSCDEASHFSVRRHNLDPEY